MKKEFLEPRMVIVVFENDIVASSGECPCVRQCSGVCAGDWDE